MYLYDSVFEPERLCVYWYLYQNKSVQMINSITYEVFTWINQYWICEKDD